MNLSRSETGGSGRHQISDFQRHTRCFDCLFRIEREPLWRPLRSTSLSAGCGRHRAAGKASSGSTGAIRWLRVRSRRSVPRPSIAHGVLGAGVQGLQALAPPVHSCGPLFTGILPRLQCRVLSTHLSNLQRLETGTSSRTGAELPPNEVRAKRDGRVTRLHF